MPAAARVGDLTSPGHGSPDHGTPLGPGPGSPDVRIGGKPAWRMIADVHACPQVDAPMKAHGAGPVLKGSTSVLINNLGAARLGDEVIEAGGGPNKITSGCTSVNIGG